MGESNERIPPLDWSSTAKSASMKQSRVPMCIRRIFTTVEEHFRENGKGCENRHLQSTQESSFYRSGTGEQRTHEQLVKQKKILRHALNDIYCHFLELWHDTAYALYMYRLRRCSLQCIYPPINFTCRDGGGKKGPSLCWVSPPHLSFEMAGIQLVLGGVFEMIRERCKFMVWMKLGHIYEFIFLEATFLWQGVCNGAECISPVAKASFCVGHSCRRPVLQRHILLKRKKNACCSF